MCGIAGFVSNSGNFKPEQLLRASKTLRHRGPDDEGLLFLDQNGQISEVFSGEFGMQDFLSGASHFSQIQEKNMLAGFLHRRLAIIAPENEGHQPISDPERKVWLTFNGEIYNYMSLREELKKSGCLFRTRTDSEVLLQAYKTWGENCLSRLDGMWSFAILDLEKRKLFASVDRTGVKPFYYFKNEKGFCFASEIKAFKDFGIDLRENPKTVSRYLAFGQSDESEETMFNDIFRLGAGRLLKIDLDSQDFKVETYHEWEIEKGFDFQPQLKENERVETIQNLLLEMIGLRLQSDVPLGVCLSGGIDSSTIAGLMANADQLAKNTGIRKAFMAVLPAGSPFDESHFARKMAQRSGFEFFTTQPNQTDFVASFRDLIYTQDEPSPGLNAFSQYEVFKKVAGEGVRVTLDGQGADEIFAGYPRHHESNLFEGVVNSAVPWSSLNFAKEAGINYLRFIIGTQNYLKILQRFKPEYSSLDPRVFEWAGEKNNFFQDVNQGLKHEFSHSSLPFLLKAADRNSMRWSVESRMPFADFSPLVQYLFEIPGSAKIQNGYTKSLLRKAAQAFVPQEIMNRTDKVGFAAPNFQWLAALLSSEQIQSKKNDSEFIDSKSFESAKRKFLHNPQASDYQLIWRIVSFLEWKSVFC